MRRDWPWSCGQWAAFAKERDQANAALQHLVADGTIIARGNDANYVHTSVTKHLDFFMHTLAHGGKTSSGTTGYIRVASWQAKPGEGDAFVEHIKKYVLPMLDAEVADGTVVMYNFDTEDIHRDPQSAYFLAVVYPSGEAMDRAYARLAATSKENLAVGEVIANITITEAHRDSLGKVSAYQHK